MTKVNQKKDKDSLDTMVAAVTGAVIGAGLAVAGAVALKEDNRQKMKDALIDTKDKAVKYVDDLQRQAELGAEALEDKLEDSSEEAKNAVKAAKDSVKSNQKDKM